MIHCHCRKYDGLHVATDVWPKLSQRGRKVYGARPSRVRLGSGRGKGSLVIEWPAHGAPINRGFPEISNQKRLLRRLKLLETFRVNGSVIEIFLECCKRLNRMRDLMRRAHVLVKFPEKSGKYHSSSLIVSHFHSPEVWHHIVSRSRYRWNA